MTKFSTGKVHLIKRFFYLWRFRSSINYFETLRKSIKPGRGGGGVKPLLPRPGFLVLRGFLWMF